MTDHHLWTAGVMAAVLQLLGYALYYWKIHRHEIQPNPLTWLMFGYGTLLLFLLEWDSSATWAELLLPLACALCGFMLAVDIWIRALAKARASTPAVQWYRFWPRSWTFQADDVWGVVSFKVDLSITFGYLMLWLIATVSVIVPGSEYDYTVLAFLALTNLSTFPGFVPTLRQTYLHPKEEHWAPWTIWTLAYALLLWVSANNAPDVPPASWWEISTWDIEHWSWISLMVYPASNVVMHGWVAYLALPFRHQRQLATPHLGE